MARNEAEPPTRSEIITAVEVARNKLERADEIENLIERTEQLERLTEQLDLLEDDIAALDVEA